MTATVTIYADQLCPWAFVALHRLRNARDRHSIDVTFDMRAWPLEWVNEAGVPGAVFIQAETSLLAEHEPELFSAYTGRSFPSTELPAFELVAAARRAFGLRAAEDIAYHIGLRFFRHSADISLRHELRQIALDAGLDADSVMHVWQNEPVQADVAADYEHSRSLPIEGSPQIFWPDGTTTHNPGMRDRHWVRGLMRLGNVDHSAPERLLLEKTGRESQAGR